MLEESQPEVARRAAAEIVEGVLRDAPDDPDPVVALARLLVAVSAERDAVTSRCDSDAEVLRAAVASGQGADAVRDVLRRRGVGATLRGPRGRWLDPAAVEDRLLRERHEADQRWEVTARALAAQPLDGLGPALREDVRRCARDVLDDAANRWPLRVEAVALLDAGGARHLPEAGAVEARERLERVAGEDTEDPWVQAEALARSCDGADPAADRGRLVAVLLERSDRAHPDHVFTRGRAAAIAGRRGHHDLLWELLRRGSSSEHVRMQAVRALGRSPEAEDRARVAGLLATAGEDWRVGAAGALAVLDGVRDMPETMDALGEALGACSRAEACRVVLDGVLGRWRLGVLGERAAAAMGTPWSRALRALTRHHDADLRRLAAVLATWSGLQRVGRTRAALRQILDAVVGAEEGASVRLTSGEAAGLTGDELLDALLVISHEDVDLSARPLGGGVSAEHPEARPLAGWEIQVGLRARRAAWRIRHELRHPRSDKRQGHHHTVDQEPAGPFVAWSGRMSEVTRTEVPGRRVSSPTTLGWDEHLPLPANLGAAARLGGIRVRTPDEVLWLRPEGRARRGVTRGYVELADLRSRLSDRPRAEAVAAYDDAVASTGFSVVREPASWALGPWALDWLGAAGASDAHAMGELALVSGGALGVWGVTKAWREHRLTQWRSQVPLVVGGWGSRGKSSVERLKAAVFHGLGYTVLCKSTGCEAMLLAAIPGVEATEVYLYRPRDKATIVEQADVLRVAAGWRPQVLLWECMALNPIYTHILQRSWMRDDVTTITNTYPDHEDVQGPSGRDVADTIGTFTPRRGTLVTSEHHMTPVLERRARTLDTAFVGCRPEDWDLVPRDLIARFPYREYDRNIALVARMAGTLGIPGDVAIRAMADHVLTDLGAFKRYGPVEALGRQAAFVNGCSANDRASFLSNWQRADLDTIPDGAGLSDWLVIVLNNRADRLARQAMFARIAAEDMAADRLVIIGTNVVPMAEQIAQELRETLAPRLRLLGQGEGGRDRLRSLFARRLRRRPLHAAAVEQAIDAHRPEAASGAAWERAAGDFREEVTWLQDLHRDDHWPVDEAIEVFLRRFSRRIVPFADPTVPGDAIIEEVAALAPEGARVELLGCENIKGTGLDLVYRWVSVDRVQRWLDAALGDDAVAASTALERLASYDGWGRFDAAHARATLEAARADGSLGRRGLAEDLEAALANAVRAQRTVAAKRAGGRGQGWTTRFLAWWRRVDVVSSMRRRWRADQLYAEFAAGRVGRERAAEVAKLLVDGEKG